LPAAISADITPKTAGKKRGFCRLRSLPALTGNFGGHYSENRGQKGVTFARYSRC